MHTLCTKGEFDVKQPTLSSAKRYLRPIAYGILAGAISCMLFLLALAAFMGMRDVPQSLVSLFSILAFVLGGFISGFVSASLAREKGLLLGLVCALGLFIILLLVNLMFDGGGIGMQAVVKLIAVMLAAAIGGILGVNRKKKFKTR